MTRDRRRELERLESRIPAGTGTRGRWTKADQAELERYLGDALRPAFLLMVDLDDPTIRYYPDTTPEQQARIWADTTMVGEYTAEKARHLIRPRFYSRQDDEDRLDRLLDPVAEYLAGVVTPAGSVQQEEVPLLVGCLLWICRNNGLRPANAERVGQALVTRTLLAAGRSGHDGPLRQVGELPALRAQRARLRARSFSARGRRAWALRG